MAQISTSVEIKRPVGRPRKYNNARPTTIYLEKEILNELDNQKGSLSRSEYLEHLILTKGKEIGSLIRENEELKKRLAEYSKKLQEYEERIKSLKGKHKSETQEENNELKHLLKKYLELTKRINESGGSMIEELTNERRAILKRINIVVEQEKVDKRIFWKLVNEGNIEKAVELLNR
jgi:predicted RNase H-like nuclease (RuvC/YqgF family)